MSEWLACTFSSQGSQVPGLSCHWQTFCAPLNCYIPGRSTLLGASLLAASFWQSPGSLCRLGCATHSSYAISNCMGVAVQGAQPTCLHSLRSLARGSGAVAVKGRQTPQASCKSIIGKSEPHLQHAWLTQAVRLQQQVQPASITHLVAQPRLDHTPCCCGCWLLVRCSQKVCGKNSWLLSIQLKAMCLAACSLQLTGVQEPRLVADQAAQSNRGAAAWSVRLSGRLLDDCCWPCSSDQLLGCLFYAIIRFAASTLVVARNAAQCHTSDCLLHTVT